MKKQALAIALASVVGTFVAVGPANAAPPGPPVITGGWVNPVLNNAERSGLCLIESALSVVAANVAHSGCAAADGYYDLVVDVDVAGNGYATLDDVYLTNTLSPANPILGKGQKCAVRQAVPGKLFTPGRTGGVLVGNPNYQGNHSWNYTNTIFIDQAPEFGVGGVRYDEHSIKDFYKPRNNPNNLTTEDYGLEVITKLTYPREKWWQTSAYKRENGGDGYIDMTKYRLVPQATCTIRLHLDGANVGGEFGYVGLIEVVSPP